MNAYTLTPRRLNHLELASVLDLQFRSDLQKLKVKIDRGDFPGLVFPSPRHGGFLESDVVAFKAALKAVLEARTNAIPSPAVQPAISPRDRRANPDRRGGNRE